MNVLDFASYFPKLGRLTANLTSAADESGKEFYLRDRGKRKPNKPTKKKDGAVMMVKKPIVTPYPNAYRSNQWTRSISPTAKQNVSILLPKARRTPQPQKKKKSQEPMSRPPEKVLEPKAVSSDVGSKDLLVIQQAMDEFKTQRDQFVRLLGGLQRKLLKFRVPNLFSSTANLEKLAEKVNPPTSAEKHINATPKDRISRAKEVRSVSQHFYLADMTASESSTSSSSDGSQEGDTSEIELAKRKVNKFLDYDLIPIQPPENRHPASQGRKTPLKKIPNKPAAVTPLTSQLTQLRKGVSEIVKKIPTKAEVTKPKTVKAVQWNVEPKLETWGRPLSPVTRAAVTSEFKKLKKASELKLRNKLKKL